eukprot:COSAG04_NODE_31826_length_254_cov_1.406452_1_plen_30_part_01
MESPSHMDAVDHNDIQICLGGKALHLGNAI